MAPQFYRFFPSGYVFTGTPEGSPADIDCARTKPNGAPFCDTYQIRNNLIAIADLDPEPFSLSGAAPVLSGEALTPVEGNAVTSLAGFFGRTTATRSASAANSLFARAPTRSGTTTSGPTTPSPTSPRHRAYPR